MNASDPIDEQHRIHTIKITPVAFRDRPLLNAVGVHEPFALRSVVEVMTDSGITGLGETYGDQVHLERLGRAARELGGVDVFDTNAIRRRVILSLVGDSGVGGYGVSNMVTGTSTSDRVLSAFEVAALDIQGKVTGRPVSDLLGGAVRPAVPFSGYLFYKWAGHPGQQEDVWGEALDPAGIVAQARKMQSEFGFGALKLKGGVFAPQEEVAAILALRETFPDVHLRLDPNAAWTLDTAEEVGAQLDGVLEYLEDPVAGIRGMSEARSRVPMPLATNMCVVSFDDMVPSLKSDAVDVILSDHHFWGGLRRSQVLAGMCEAFGLGLSMHSNSHLGISLAAMVHLAAATPNLDYACDTHWPWKSPDEDVIVDGVLEFVSGAVAVPTGPGLGIQLDPDKLNSLHEQYLTCGIRERDDTGYMQKFDPEYEVIVPRW